MDSVVKSAARVLEVFEYFSERRGPATVNDISFALRYPQSSTSVLLKSLHTLGYLRQDPLSRAYRPTMKIARIAEWLDPGPELRQMVALVHAETGYPAELVRRIDLHIESILLTTADDGERSERLGYPLAIRHAAGRALLSLEPNDMALRILVGSQRLRIAGEPIDEAAFLADLQDIRRAGIAVMPPGLNEPVGDIAIPIPAHANSQPMAIAVHVAAGVFDTAKPGIINALKRIAAPMLTAAEAADGTNGSRVIRAQFPLNR